jgi:hypothetical protein
MISLKSNRIDQSSEIIGFGFAQVGSGPIDYAIFSAACGARESQVRIF